MKLLILFLALPILVCNLFAQSKDLREIEEPPENKELMTVAASLLSDKPQRITTREDYEALVAQRFKNGMTFDEVLVEVSDHLRQLKPSDNVIALLIRRSSIAIEIRRPFSDTAILEFGTTFVFSPEQKLTRFHFGFTIYPK